jgi:hypothetical protein
MSVIVLPASSSASNPCRVCYDNLLERGTVTATSEHADYPVKNCYDGNTADFFRPAASGTVNIDLTLANAASANYLAFYAQDLFQNGGSIKLQYHNGSGYVDASDTASPADNSPRVIFFDSKTATLWRVVISCSAIFNIGVLAFGAYLPLRYGMYRGWTPPILARANKLLNNISDSGAFLGRTIISKGSQTSFVLQYASDGWVRDSWLPFMKYAERKPWFWVPHFRKYPTEAAFCQVEGDLTPPQHTHPGFMGCSFQVRALVE